MTIKDVNNNNAMNISLLEREGISSSSSLGNLLLTDRLGLEGKEREYRGGTLSLCLDKSFGFSYKKKKTIRELAIISKYDEIVDEMSDQKCFTNARITGIFDRHQNDKTIKLILGILVQRRVLYMYMFHGKAKATFGLPVYYTHDATESDLEECLTVYTTLDEIRYVQELKRKKDAPKTPKEVTAHNDEMIRLKKVRLAKEKAKAREKCCDYTITNLGGTGLVHHKCGKGTVRQIVSGTGKVAKGTVRQMGKGAAVRSSCPCGNLQSTNPRPAITCYDGACKKL